MFALPLTMTNLDTTTQQLPSHPIFIPFMPDKDIPAHAPTWPLHYMPTTYGLHGDGNDLSDENNSYVLYGETPWGVVHNKMQTYRGVIGLHNEILDFYQWSKGTPADHMMRCEVVHRVHTVLSKFFPQGQFHIFGSFATGLYLPMSDIDVVITGKLESVDEFSIISELYNQGVAENVLNLKNAQVPILKITDRKTRLKVDVSFNTLYGVKCAEFIKENIQKYPCFPHLVFIIKYFLSSRKLNEVYTGGLSSYSIVLMVIFFLQTHPKFDAKLSTTNLGVLLMEFFELYGRDFNYAKCAVDVTSKGMFVPKERAVDVLRRNGAENYEPSFLVIRDPIDPKNDVSKGSHKAFQVRDLFEFAYHLLEYRILPKTSDMFTHSSILSCIFTIPLEHITFREWVSKHYESPSSSPYADREDGSEVVLPKYPTIPPSLYMRPLNRHCAKAKPQKVKVVGRKRLCKGEPCMETLPETVIIE